MAVRIVVVCFYLFVFLISSGSPALDFRYHSQDELEKLLYELSDNITEPLQARTYSIGKSIRGRDLLVFEITAALNNSEIVPNIRLTGNIHGNEPPGREVLLHFIEYLIENYNKDEQIHWLLDNSRIHILPCLNPDGWEQAEIGDCVGVVGRQNANNFDLNRNFPDFIHGSKKIEQKETSAVIHWNQNVSFALAGDIHAGAVVTIYPFHRVTKINNELEKKSSITADEKVFKRVAKSYANHNDVMYRQSIFCDNETFSEGVTRGADWYHFLGGMQDYSYMAHGTIAITFEISCCKYPSEDELSTLWEQNKKSLVMFCSEANRGVSGQVIDSITSEPISNANITILGIKKIYHTNQNGRFWKILLPGKYHLRAEARGYQVGTWYSFVVENEEETFLELIELKILMDRT